MPTCQCSSQRVTMPTRPRRMVVIRQSSQITLSAHRSLRNLGAVRKAATLNRKDPARNLRIGLQPWSLTQMLDLCDNLKRYGLPTENHSNTFASRVMLSDHGETPRDPVLRRTSDWISWQYVRVARWRAKSYTSTQSVHIVRHDESAFGQSMLLVVRHSDVVEMSLNPDAGSVERWVRII